MGKRLAVKLSSEILVQQGPQHKSFIMEKIYGGRGQDDGKNRKWKKKKEKRKAEREKNLSFKEGRELIDENVKSNSSSLHQVAATIRDDLIDLQVKDRSLQQGKHLVMIGEMKGKGEGKDQGKEGKKEERKVQME